MNNWLNGLVAEKNQINPANPTRGNAKKVIDALRDGKKTTAQLEADTGLTAEQVREVFRRHRGRSIISEPVRYSLAPLPANG